MSTVEVIFRACIGLCFFLKGMSLIANYIGAEMRRQPTRLTTVILGVMLLFLSAAIFNPVLGWLS
jgi:hypothetical protein